MRVKSFSNLGAYITWLIIAYTGVALRFLSRHIKHMPLLTDDWLIVVSLVSLELIEEKIDGVLRANSDFDEVFHNRSYGHHYKPDARWPWTARKLSHEP